MVSPVDHKKVGEAEVESDAVKVTGEPPQTVVDEAVKPVFLI